MADKNVVKGRRCKSGHWTFQFGYEDPALVGAQLSADVRVVDGNSSTGGLMHPRENPAALKVLVAEVPSMTHKPVASPEVQVVENPTASQELIPEAPGITLCQKPEATAEVEIVQNKATKGKEVPTPPVDANPFGWDKKFAARVAKLSTGTIDEYVETSFVPYRKDKSSLSNRYTGSGPSQGTDPEPKAKTSPWQRIEPLDTTKLGYFSMAYRSKYDSGLRMPSMRNPNNERESIMAQPQTEDQAEAIMVDKGEFGGGKPQVSGQVVPGICSSATLGAGSSAKPRVQSEPITIGQSSGSKNKSERKLRKNTPPGRNGKGMPLVLTSILPEPRKYSIKPLHDMTKTQNGQVGYVVWVNNLSDCTTYDDLEALVKPFGPILKLKLADNRETGCWAFGYVHYQFKEDAAKAIAALDGKAFDNAVLNVVWSNPPAKPSPTS